MTLNPIKYFPGDIQEILERVDEWMKEISKKLEILTEPEGAATRDEGLFMKKVYCFTFLLIKCL